MFKRSAKSMHDHWRLRLAEGLILNLPGLAACARRQHRGLWTTATTSAGWMISSCCHV